MSALNGDELHLRLLLLRSQQPDGQDGEVVMSVATPNAPRATTNEHVFADRKSGTTNMRCSYTCLFSMPGVTLGF